MSNNSAVRLKMKTAITSKNPGIDSLVEMRFGRAPYYVIIDSETGTDTTIENPAASGAGGVGTKAVQLLLSHGVGTVITGQVGDNAARALEAAGVGVFEFREEGTVGQAYARHIEGTLSRIL